MVRAIIYVDKGVGNANACKTCFNGRRYDFVTGVGGVTPDVYRPPERVRPCAAPSPCLVVSGAAVSTV